MWQNQTVNDKLELLTLMGACATSQHVSAQVLNAAGTGYVVGEIITLTHAGAFADATFEVLTVGGGGEVLTFVRRNWGAFANRIATVTINAAGSGYLLDDILEIQGGTERQMGKAEVTGVSGTTITAVALFETGGAYSIAPTLTGAATLGVGPSTFAGNDAATIDLTMTGLIGLTGNATTASAAGTGFTLDITLTETGFFTGSQNGMRDTNDFLDQESTDFNKQLALSGTVTGGDEPFVQFMTATAQPAIDVNHYIVWGGSDAFNPSLSFDAQVNQLSSMSAAGQGRYTPMFDAQSQECWISISERKIAVAIKTQGMVTLTYQSGYTGLLNPFATTVNNPYPMVVYCSSGDDTIFPDDTQITGPVEAMTHSGSLDPYAARRGEDATVGGWRNSSPFGTVQRQRTVYPGGEGNNQTNSFDASTITGDGRRQWFDIILPTGAAATVVMLPTPDSGGALFIPIPVVLIEGNSTSEPVDVADKLRGEMENMYWITGIDAAGATIAAEDTVTDQNGVRYRVFRSGSRTESYSLFAMREE